MKLLQKRIKEGTMEVNEDDPFELFICATEIRWTYYKDTQKILGKTYDMLVLQDFEAITPNLLARKIVINYYWYQYKLYCINILYKSYS